MRAFIAGTGSIGRRHIQNIKLLDPDAEFILLRSDGYHDDLSEVLAAQVVTSFEHGLSYDPEYFLIATPSAFHCELILSCIKASLPVYIEKPVVTTRTDIRSLRQTLKNNPHLVTFAGCNLRFLDSLNIVKEMLTKGDIGNIARVSLQAGQWLPDWRPSQNYQKSYSADSKKGGGVILDLIHEFDAARWLLGNFKQVKSFSSDCASLSIDSEAVACALLIGEQLPLTAISVDYIARQPVRRYEFIGDKGTLIWDLAKQSLNLYNTEGEQHVVDCGKDGFNVSVTYKKAMKAFLKAMKSNTSLPQDIEDGLKSVELALLAKEDANL